VRGLKSAGVAAETKHVAQGASPAVVDAGVSLGSGSCQEACCSLKPLWQLGEGCALSRLRTG
jgi:hypothetical protein